MKNIIIKPITNNIIYRHPQCRHRARVWISANGHLGELRGHRLGKRFHEQISVFRFGINSTIGEREIQKSGDFLPQTIEQARLNALAIALYQFRGLLNQDDDDALRNWRLGIVSGREDFLYEVKNLIEQPEAAPFFPCGLQPTITLKKFGSVQLVQVTEEHAAIIESGENFRLSW